MYLIKTEAKAIYRHTNAWSRGTLGILVRTWQSFVETNAAEAAASIAYYALFSFFPLLILLVGFASSILIDIEVKETVLNFIAESLPTAQDLVKYNIERALAVQGTAKLAGTIGLLWAATGVFTALAHNINRAWHTARKRNFFFGRLIGLAMVATLAGLLIAWLVVTTAINLFPLLEVPLFNGKAIYETYLWSLLSRLLPAVFLFLAVINLYRWTPNTKVRWREAIVGATVSTLGMELTTRLFSWYLTSGMARYQIIYGSLGAVVALLLWIYLSSLIVLFGAHLSAAIAFETRLKGKE